MSRLSDLLAPLDCRSAPTGRRGVGPPAARPAVRALQRLLSGPFDQSPLTAVVDSVPAGQARRQATRVAYTSHRLSDVRLPLFIAAAAAVYCGRRVSVTDTL